MTRRERLTDITGKAAAITGVVGGVAVAEGQSGGMVLLLASLLLVSVYGILSLICWVAGRND